MPSTSTRTSARARSLDQQVAHAPPDRVLLPDVELEVEVVARAGDRPLHRRERRPPVVVELDPPSGQDR
jgi:hypothetical protein